MFTRIVFVEETHILKPTNVCKSIVQIESSQLYPCSMCQPIPTGLCTRYEFDADLRKIQAPSQPI